MYLRIQYTTEAAQPWAVHDKVVGVSLCVLMTCTTRSDLLKYCGLVFQPKASVLQTLPVSILVQMLIPVLKRKPLPE